MLNVLQLFSQTNRQKVIDEVNAAYDIKLNMEIYEYFLNNISKKILIKTPGVVQLDKIEEIYEDDRFNVTHIDVVWYLDQRYTMSFVRWGEILAAPVEDNSNELSLEQQAAHIFQEMTWHGIEEEETIAKLDELSDAFEKCQKDIDAHTQEIEKGNKEEGSLPDGFVRFDFEKHMSDLSEEDKEYMRLLKTVKVYRNGILINNAK